MKKMLYITLTLATTILSASELVIRDQNGELEVIHFDSNETFADMMTILKQTFGDSEDFLLDFMAHTPCVPKASSTQNRQYYKTVTANEKNDVSYIINTLGMASLAKVTKSKSSLKKAGDRVDHIHPLRFLAVIFSDEQMKASMHAMQSRGWIWKEFIGNLGDTFEEEATRGTLTSSEIADFSQKLNLDATAVENYLAQHKWSGLVDYMIQQIPRNANHERYNM